MVGRFQNGVALISALLLTAIATLIAAALLQEHSRVSARTQNLVSDSQVMEYITGLEAYAASVLVQDIKDNNADIKGEPWSAPLPPLPVPGGSVTGQLHDLSGRFNLNNLVNDEGVISGDQVALFKRLLGHLRINTALADVVVDWIDPDTVREPEGAEDNYYLRQTPGYRAANHYMRDITELRLLAGVNTDVFARLEPHVAALPHGARLNVNMASPEVLASLSDLLNPGMMEGLSESAQFTTLDEFLQHPTLQGVVITQAQQQKLSVLTRFFEAFLEVDIYARKLAYRSLIRRDGVTVSVLQRFPAFTSIDMDESG